MPEPTRSLTARELELLQSIDDRDGCGAPVAYLMHNEGFGRNIINRMGAWGLIGWARGGGVALTPMGRGLLTAAQGGKATPQTPPVERH